MITTSEKNVLDHINMDELLGFLCDLIAVKSLDGSPEENEAQKLIAEWLLKEAFETDCWEIDMPALKQHPEYSAEVDRQHALGVIAKWGASGRSLVLNGHVDVVPADNPELWTVSPWQGTIKNGRVYGRGSVDMKGGLCCALYALKAVRDAGVNLPGRVILQSVIGEEDGGMGTLAACLRAGEADGAIIMEPTNLVIAPSQAGAFNFRITIPGKTAHGAVRQEGVSAIEKFIKIHNALMEFEAARNKANKDPLFADYELPNALNIGNIQGGDWASNVPESVVVEGRFGAAANEDPEKAKRAFEAVIRKCADQDEWLREHPPVVTWWGAQFKPAETPAEHPVVLETQKAFEDVVQKPAYLQGMTYGADMRLLVNVAKTPTLIFGPGEIQRAHQPDEYVPIEHLETVSRTLVLTILRFCK